MLSIDIEQPDDCHLFANCDVTVEEFELLCGSKIQNSDDDNDDSEWEEAESQTFFFLFPDLYYYIFCYDKDLLHNSIKKKF